MVFLKQHGSQFLLHDYSYNINKITNCHFINSPPEKLFHKKEVTTGDGEEHLFDSKG